MCFIWTELSRCFFCENSWTVKELDECIQMNQIWEFVWLYIADPTNGLHNLILAIIQNMVTFTKGYAKISHS